MRLAIIADIHSNIIIFEQVLDRLKKDNIDEIIYLGDYITDGPASKYVLDLVKKTGSHIILGNREKYILNFDPDRRGFANYDTIADTYDSLSIDDKKYIETLKEYELVDLDGFKTLLIHGDGYYKFGMNLEDFYDSLIEKFDFDICLYGHTHEFDDTTYRGRRFINPGGLSQPSDTPSYKYAILTFNGELDIQKIELPTRDSFEKVVEYYKGTEYYQRHKIWCDLFLLLTRDCINYQNTFLSLFNSKLKEIDELDRTAYNSLYEKCFEEFMMDVDLP